jgi:ribosomal protein S2
LFSNFSIFQLIKNYGHIGYPSALTNVNSLFYILGRYYNISIIDINKSLFLLKNYFFLLSNIILKGGYLFLAWNSLKYKKYTLNCSFCYFIYRWIPGMITNFRKVKKVDLKKKISPKFKKKITKLRFPNFVINFGFNKNIQSQEGFGLPLPFLSIVDTIHNVGSFNFFILYNTKSMYSSFLLYKIFLDFLEKMIFVKKSFFFNIFKKRLTLFNGTKSKK